MRQKIRRKRDFTHGRHLSLSLKSALMTFLVFSLMSCSTEDTQTVVNFTELTFQDEFEVDGSPDPSKWVFDIGRGPNNDGWGNQELQYYTDREENVTVKNGFLIITARNESFQGASYTSARLLTKGVFEQQYGRFEARMRLPYGQGMWPAFWMLGADIDTNPWPGCGEIDIMENKGRTPTIVSGALHGPGYWGANPEGSNPAFKEYELMNDRFDTGFHIFGIEWGPQYINLYVDDVLYKQFTPEDEQVTGPWVFDQGPFFMLLNLAVGGNFDGPPNNETVFPQTLLVDYVRVYKYNGLN